MEKVNAVNSEKTKKDIFRAFKKATDLDKPFKMKDVWAPHRKFFVNFLKFNTNNDRQLYNAVAGQNILLVDDFKTSGTTIKEMIRQLSELGAANIVVFVLIKIE
jgi:orotate phosphoribosyltransferase